MWTKENTAKTVGGRPFNRQGPPKALTPGDLYPVASGQPRGAVLIYTLVVLILMTLMGAALMVNSRTELQISGNTAEGRDAFTKADASARVALLLARAFLHPTSGEPRDYYSGVSATEYAGQKPFTIKLSDDVDSVNDLQQLKNKTTVEDIRERYLRVTEAKDEPHLTVKYGDEVVGTAYVGLAFNAPDEFNSANSSAGGFDQTGGGSVGDRTYSSADDGYGLKAYFVISSQGRVPKGGSGNYLDEGQPRTHSIVTTIFREILP